MKPQKGIRKIAVLGAGKIGESLIGGLIDAGLVARDQVVATARHQERLDSLSARFRVATTLDNAQAVRGASVVILAVKPQAMGEVLAGIRGRVTRQQLVLSVAASVDTAFIEKRLGPRVPIVRAMPNTPCLARQGMTVLARGRFADAQHLEVARRIFEPLGRCLILEERHMDAVTGLSASGPAYIYVVIESLAEGGVKVGLPRDVATTLAAQMVLGSATMVLQTGEHPAKLKDGVTTPAGCTIDGLLELEEGGLRVTLIKAVVRATRRAAELIHG
ncbi:MAG TPA: pyrroline-5-carboxylate reductase [Candidatus Polarisedimenticolia bacterium]|jgi:pyrroline-5-carboxylate reductase|nr:pyrroline-5-carboxylate reductase [Candidatus Polarisedimenticolia bacterium]